MYYKIEQSDKASDTTYTQHYTSSSSTLKTAPLKMLDLKTLSSKEGSDQFEEELQGILTYWQSDFNLEYGPIYSIGYIYGYRDGTTRIHFALHHLIVDAVSWRIIAEDLRDLYNDKELCSKGSSYRQWVDAVRDYDTSHEAEKEYWNNILADYSDCNNIIIDNNELSIGNQSNYNSGTRVLEELVISLDTKNYATLELTQEQTRQLLQDSGRAYNTQINDLLLTSLGYVLADITGSKVSHVLLEGHGREEIDNAIDINRTVGWFTTMYPVRLGPEKDLGSSIKKVKEMIRGIPNKGIGYGSLIGYDLQSLPRMSFNYLGQFDGTQGFLNQATINPRTNIKDQSQIRYWNITSERSGESIDHANQDYNIININGLVIDGKLQFAIVSKLDDIITTKIATLFKKKLEEIIIHCIKKNVTEHTMSDFDDFVPYILFNERVEGDHNRLFVLPPAVGGAESYFNNIVPKLKHKNLVLFNNYRLYLLNKFGEGYIGKIIYEDIANAYVNYIQFIQPKGPYNLLGWSLGGILAFEIARQLTGKGEAVEKLVIIDSFFNYKRALLETKTQFNGIDEMSYKYLPTLNDKMFNINITLFKALIPIEYNALNVLKYHVNPQNLDKDIASDFKILKHYTENTKYNYLEDILKSKKFKLITMNSTHTSWVNNDYEIIKICNEL